MNHVDLYLLDQESSGRSIKTLRWHQQSLNVFVKWIAAEGRPTNPSERNATMLREYFVRLQGQGWAGWTVRNRASSVKAFVRWLFDEELIERNVAERVKTPMKPQFVKKPFTDGEMRQLIATSKACRRAGVRDYAMVLFLFDTGVRLAELVGLTEQSFYFNNRAAIVLGKGNKERMVFFSKRPRRR